MSPEHLRPSLLANVIDLLGKKSFQVWENGEIENWWDAMVEIANPNWRKDIDWYCRITRPQTALI